MDVAPSTDASNISKSLSVRARAQSNKVVILVEVDSVPVFLQRLRNAELLEEISKNQVQVEDMIRPTDDVLIRDGQLVQHDRDKQCNETR